MYADSLQINRFETWELDAMVAQIERPNPFLLSTFFAREKMFASATIEFDLIDRGRRLAPFVSPLVAGKPSRREGSRVRQLTPAYIKPNDLVRPTDSYVRMPGEAYGGTMSPMQRFERLVAQQISDHMDQIDNRLEWMAASALVNGGITIEGEDYPTVWVDFGRDPALNVNLLGAAQWDQPTAKPMEDIEAASIAVRRISKGAVVGDLIMDSQTWNLLKKSADLKELINVFNRNHMQGQQVTAIDGGPRNTMNEAVMVGTLSGRFSLWVYDSYYQDDTGADQPYIPPYTVLGISRAAIEGTQYFGGILDLDASLEPRKTFTKTEKKFNPSGLEVVTQSAPLVAPRRPNAMFKIVVK